MLLLYNLDHKLEREHKQLIWQLQLGLKHLMETGTVETCEGQFLLFFKYFVEQTIRK